MCIHVYSDANWLNFFVSIYTCHDDAKDKDFELELSWICAESKYKHHFVPEDIKAEAERLAKVRLATFIIASKGRAMINLLLSSHFLFFLQESLNDEMED